MLLEVKGQSYQLLELIEENMVLSQQIKQDGY
jgi:hypothetical protein